MGVDHLVNPDAPMKVAGVLVASVHPACAVCGEDLTFLQFGFCLPQNWAHKLSGYESGVGLRNLFPSVLVTVPTWHQIFHVDYFALITHVHGMLVPFLPLFPDCRMLIVIFVWCIVLCPRCGLGVVTFRLLLTYLGGLGLVGG